MDRCRRCAAGLVAGPAVERSATSADFAVHVDGIPTLLCSLGCPGQYAPWPDLALDILDLVSPDHDNVARRRLSPNVENRCRTCDVALVRRGDHGTFVFTRLIRTDTPVTLTVETPALTWPECSRRHIPAQTPSWDGYHADLTTVIGRAITDQLFWS